MIYPYTEDLFLEPETQKITKVFHPFLPITILKRGFKVLRPFDCLLDSGADSIIFPAEIAVFYDIPFKKFSLIPTDIAGGGKVHLYEVPYEIHGMDLFAEDIRVREPISFSEGQEMPLLGQDFFKYFKITFERTQKQFSLEATK